MIKTIINYQLTIKREKVKGNEVSNLSVILSRVAHGQKPSSLFPLPFSLFPLPFSLLFIICYLLLIPCSCDFFTGPKVDLFQQISDEVDWANAPKLSVRIDYPSAWGISNPPQGSITPARDIRKGYEFSVEFTPEMAFTLVSWQVYRTADLDGLGNWLANLALINPKDIQPLGPGEVTLPAPNPSGGTFNFTIHTTEPVTLIPWCDTQPRITGTEPRNRPDGQPYSSASSVALYFNCALDAGTIKFADAENADGIWITAKLHDGTITTNKDKNWFSKPEYATEGGFFTVTMNPGVNTLPPENSLMTVRVKGIRNVQGEPMETAYSFSWNTSSVTNVYFESWSAEYKYNADTNLYDIVVSWDQTGADNVITYYRLNNGSNTHLTTSEPDKITLSHVPVPDASGVREGKSVSGIREYMIFIELYAAGIMESRASFKIWNFPGMKVSDTYPVVEVRTAEELAAMNNNLDKQYVLANDIIVSGAWNPVGDEANPFTGNLYGNGYAVAINGFTAGSDIGLFGVVSGSIVRDLTVVYGNVTVSAASNVGGIAGQMWSGASILNSAVKGASGTETLALTQSGSGGACLGGIAGMVSESFIGNCRAGLNVKLDSSGTAASEIGAVAGFAESGSGDCISIDIGYTNPQGKGPNITLANLAIDGVTVTANVSGNTSGTGDLNIGGAAGYSSNNTMRDIVSGGGVTFDRTNVSGNTNVGGITGYANNVNMEACSSVGGAVGTINKFKDADTWMSMGGLIGISYINNGGDVYINKCLVRGNIKVEVKDYGNIVIGGVLGNSTYTKSIVTITNSFFEEGNITAVNSSGSIQAGGFCGSFYEEDYWIIAPDQRYNSHYTNNCGAMAGTVTVDIKEFGRYIQAGGFTSSITGDISNCFSRANVITRGGGNSDEEGSTSDTYTHLTGGFTGILNPDSTITSCYATGTVRSVHNGDRDLNVGGLVGFSLGTIENCYALGDVLADKTTGDSFSTNAGGLVGASWGTVQYSFSAGQVFAQSANSRAYAGGVFGLGVMIKNTAALGGSVTASGPDPNVGRIVGTGYNLSDNYANYKMLTGTGAYQTRITEEEIPEDDTGPNTLHGGDITIGSHTVDLNFWSGKLGFNNAGSYESAAAPWDFSTVVGKGYPVLEGLAGQ